jgi:transcriptional regulator with XRE-family HTH domain
MKDNEIEVKFKMILDLIYNERIAQKYTQNEIAKQLNINTGSYSLIENGKQKLLYIDALKIPDILKLNSKIYNILEGKFKNSE